MRTIIKNSILALFFFVSFASFSQIGSNRILQRTTIDTYDQQSKGVVGTSYINDNFLPAKLIDGVETYAMRYNAYKDVFEVQRDGEVFYYLPKEFDYSVTFTSDKKEYQVFLYEENNKKITGFFVVLKKGEKLSLLLREKINFHKEVKVKSQLDTYKPSTLKRASDVFFIGDKNNTSTKLPRRKKKFFKLFSNKSHEVASFVKKQKLSFKDKEDLIEIFTYYNSLK
jgi:hypothetical protein